MGGRNKKAAKELRRRQRLLSIASDSSEDSVDNCIYEKKYLRVNPCPKYCKPKTKNQALFLSSIMSPNSQVVVCHGSAGTGKTLMACQEGIRSLLNNDSDSIIITRPAVCADEDIGFLPGDLDDKMKPFTQPLFDTFEKIIPRQHVEHMIHNNKIQIIPLAYMRGRTFENKFIIADEMQNASIEQMIMLLTRIGSGSKLIVVGDPSQCDRKIKQNGLSDLINRLEKSSNSITKVKLIKLENKDVQREDVVKEILSIVYADRDDNKKSNNSSLVKSNSQQNFL